MNTSTTSLDDINLSYSKQYYLANQEKLKERRRMRYKAKKSEGESKNLSQGFSNQLSLFNFSGLEQLNNEQSSLNNDLNIEQQSLLTKHFLEQSSLSFEQIEQNAPVLSKIEHEQVDIEPEVLNLGDVQQNIEQSTSGLEQIQQSDKKGLEQKKEGEERKIVQEKGRGLDLKSLFLGVIALILAFFSIVILQNDSYSFYRSEKSSFELFNFFFGRDASQMLAFLKASIPELLILFLSFIRFEGILKNILKYTVILTVVVHSIISVSVHVNGAMKGHIAGLNSQLMTTELMANEQKIKGEAEEAYLKGLRDQESELKTSLSNVNSDPKNAWMIPGLNRKLSECRGKIEAILLRKSTQSLKQEAFKAEDIKEEILALEGKSRLFVIYRIIMFAACIFVMSCAGELLLGGRTNKKGECAYV